MKPSSYETIKNRVANRQITFYKNLLQVDICNFSMIYDLDSETAHWDWPQKKWQKEMNIDIIQETGEVRQNSRVN